MADYKGIAYLRNKLNSKRTRVLTRYQFYEMKNIVRDMGISTPPELRWLTETLGWCGKAVDSIADRLVFYSFIDDNFDLMEIFRMNNPDVLFDNAVLSALISSCCFIYISADETGYPRLQVIDGGNATGILDSITGLLTEGYAVLERDERGNPILEAYFIAGRTEYIRKGKSLTQVVKNNAPYPLLVPIIYRPDAVRPFGHSRISRACMKIMEAAVRTIKRSEISAEFYSFPQKYVEGDKPTLGQFTQQSMSPYTEQLRTLAALFAGETGLTLDDLGFVSENPSSSEAIKASHENLRLIARKAQRTFGSGLLNTGYLAACLRDDYQYQRRQLYLTKPTWEPIFEPDAAMLSSMGDGVIKINQSVPGYFNNDNLRIMTGIEPSRLAAPVITNANAGE